MKKYSIIIVFILGIVVRILYSVAVPDIIYGADSSGYYSIGKEMFSRPALATIVHPYRTPLYPFFMNAVFYSLGLGGIPEGSQGFDRGLTVIVTIQMVVGAAAFAVFFRALHKWIPASSTYPLLVFLLLDVYTFGWERSILTEGLAVSLLLITTAALLQVLEKPTKRVFLLLFVLFTLAFLLRPAMLTIPVATLPILAWYFRTQIALLLTSIFTLIAFLLVPAAYAQVNRMESGYTGIQIVGDIDILGRILEENLPIESAKNYTYFYETVRDYRTKNLTPHPFRFLEYYDAGIYTKMDRFTELHGFNETVLLHALPQFLTRMIVNIPEVMLEVNEFTRVPPEATGFAATIVQALQILYGKIQYVTLLIPFMWIVIVVLWLIRPTRSRTLTALLGTIVMSQILLTAAVVYRDFGGQYQRLLSVIRPHMFLFLFLSLYQWYTRKSP